MQELDLRDEYFKSLKNPISSRRDMTARENYPLAVLSKAGIPRLYQEVEIEDYVFGKDKNGKMAEKVIYNYLENLHDAFDSCVNILFHGTCGSGKTFLSSIILKRAFEYYYSVKLCSFATVISSVFAKKEEAEDYLQYEFLCIDEVGKETQLNSKANVFLLEQILRLRDQYGLPTIICTNLDLIELRAIYGDSIISLMSQGVVLQLGGEDKRQEAIINRDGFRRVMGWEE